MQTSAGLGKRRRSTLPQSLGPARGSRPRGTERLFDLAVFRLARSMTKASHGCCVQDKATQDHRVLNSCSLRLILLRRCCVQRAFSPSSPATCPNTSLTRAILTARQRAWRHRAISLAQLSVHNEQPLQCAVVKATSSSRHSLQWGR
jgi:hypothetical protein